MQMMKKRHAALVLGALTLGVAGCKDFLDVNTNPNGPQIVSANLYLAPMLHWMVTSPQFDGRYVSRYNQEFQVPVVTGTNPSTWDRMGYDPAPSDNGGQQWRDVYWSLGQNLEDMMAKAQAEQRWDLLGVGQVLKAWGWEAITDLHGEIVIKEALQQTRTTFDYDTQEYAYSEIQRLLGEAIKNLQRTDGAVDATYLGRTDIIYKGDRTKWLKLAYGMQALNLNHYSNKASYKPADVVAAVDKSLASNADDPLLTYTGTSPDNADFNFLGARRGNFNAFRQTKFVVALLDGTDFGVPDPRLTRMLSPSTDGVVRGTDPGVANGGTFGTNQAPNNPFGYTGTLGAGLPGRYLFSDKAKIPVMTYAQLQFIKAEAAFRSGDKATALAAYTKGVSAHIDWVNDRNRDDNQTPTQITAAEKSAFLANPAIIPTSASALTLTQIMSQKYIAQWGWGHDELWMDLRRYHYTDVDPATSKQIYPGFVIPTTTLYPDNLGKPVQRIRPRYASEYVWNRPGLDAIGGLALDYHTKPLWITQP
jgi:Starch-binding associating with outer membrane